MNTVQEHHPHVEKDQESYKTDVDYDKLLEEEKKCEEDNEKELQKFRQKYEGKEHAKEMEDQRFKCLMSLLEKSQIYVQFLKDNLSKALQEAKENKKNAVTKKTKKKGKPKVLGPHNSQENPNSSQESTEKAAVNSNGIMVDRGQPQLLEGGALYPYQLEGLQWLITLFESGINGILADEMGLGKTVQAIGLICHLYQQGVSGPFLICAPLSTLPNWILEFDRFAPEVPVVLFHGNVKERVALRPSLTETHALCGRSVFPVIITSYEIAIREAGTLCNLEWKYIIVDEGHRLKNNKTLFFNVLKNFNTVNRLLLTGTPLQNSLSELWCLLNFLVPEIFNDLDTFESWFAVEHIENSHMTEELLKKEKEKKILTVLNEILRPFLLRRVKKDVGLNLPPKKEVVILCPLTKFQFDLYNATLDKSVEYLAGKGKEELIIPDMPDGSKVKRRCTEKFVYGAPPKKQKLNNEMNVVALHPLGYKFNIKLANPAMMLRKIANHPYLVQRPITFGPDEGLITSSGKLDMLDKLLRRLKADSHKVLLFSNFKIILDLVEDLMEMRGYNYCRLDGNTKLQERREAILSFNTDPNVFVFLLSTRAGGLGINLTAADTVVIFDSDWNPHSDIQAQDRCHRLGQVRPVLIYRFITPGTIDERILNRALAKRKLESLVLRGESFSFIESKKNIGEVETLRELRDLLSKTYHQMEVNAKELTEKDWAALLDRSELK